MSRVDVAPCHACSTAGLSSSPARVLACNHERVCVSGRLVCLHGVDHSRSGAHEPLPCGRILSLRKDVIIKSGLRCCHHIDVAYSHYSECSVRSVTVCMQVASRITAVLLAWPVSGDCIPGHDSLTTSTEDRICAHFVLVTSACHYRRCSPVTSPHHGSSASPGQRCAVWWRGGWPSNSWATAGHAPCSGILMANAEVLHAVPTRLLRMYSLYSWRQSCQPLPRLLIATSGPPRARSWLREGRGFNARVPPPPCTPSFALAPRPSSCYARRPIRCSASPRSRSCCAPLWAGRRPR